MQTRTLGDTDLNLTTIGFGAWAAGGPWQFGWGPQNDDDSIAAIHEALELGINWIDTAAAYGLGHSEEVVGRAIKGRRDRVIIATKCGLAWDDPSSGTVIHRLKRWSVRREAEGSLRRLGTEQIDLYQVHWPDPNHDIEEAWEEIARLIEEGKVRYAGVSNFDVSQIQCLQRIHPVASLQPPYSLLERGVEDELLEFCAANQIGVIAYSPMASGLLTGKYTRESIVGLDAGDWRHRDGHFREPELTANLALLDQLRPIAAQLSLTLGQLAVSWVLRRPDVTAAIVGARRPDQIAEIAPVAARPLTADAITQIEALLDRRAAVLQGQAQR